MREYADDLAELARARPDLAAELSGFVTLEKVLPWLERRGVDFGRLDLIAQDEYCHEFLTPLGEREWLALGVT